MLKSTAMTNLCCAHNQRTHPYKIFSKNWTRIKWQKQRWGHRRLVL